MLVENEQGFILHSRPFTDSKVILDVFTHSFGRISLVSRKSKKQASFKNFTPYSFSWSGKSDLKTLRQSEELDKTLLQHGRPLYCGIYLNELCIRLLPEFQSYETVFDQYLEAITKLAHCENESVLMEILLRRFEFLLLHDLGTAVNFHTCIEGEKIVRDGAAGYIFYPEAGFQRIQNLAKVYNSDSRGTVFRGQDIVDIREEAWTPEALVSAKMIARKALAPLLGNKPIKSRELFT
jgi:DNA repair protein RecO (recombination protein O)